MVPLDLTKPEKIVDGDDRLDSYAKQSGQTVAAFALLYTHQWLQYEDTAVATKYAHAQNSNSCAALDELLFCTHALFMVGSPSGISTYSVYTQL